MTATDRRVDALREARQRASRDKRNRVREALSGMLADGEPITFVAAARRAHVSTWLLYAAGVREHVDAAIKQQIDRAASNP